MTSPTVLDISKWQGVVDHAKLKAAGVLAIIAKCSEGTSYADPYYRANRSGAISNGLAFSSYHYLKKGSASAQMDYYFKTCSPVDGERMCIDYEEDGSPLSDLTAAVQRLIDIGKDQNIQISVYSGHLIKDQLGSKSNDLLAQNTSLWIAQYTSASSPSWPKQVWPQWSLWQYSDKGSVSGVNGAVDCNRFNGPNDQLLKWFGPAGAAPPAPEPQPDLPTVSITTTGAVSVSVNGRLVT